MEFDVNYPNDQGDQNFIFFCVPCGKAQRLGAVNHNYTPMPKGLRIDYHCFTCGNHEVKMLEFGKVFPPQNAKDFRERIAGKVVSFGKTQKRVTS